MLVVASSLSDQLVVAAVSSVLALTVGRLVIYFWDELRRRREYDLVAVDTFYRTYGEFFTTWKLWDAHVRYGDKGKGYGDEGKGRLESPVDVQWRLLERAATAEAGFEALLVKLASERRLDDRDIRVLGSFREAYQMLREHIRQGERLGWRATRREDADDDRQRGFQQYRAFKSLAECVAVKLKNSPGLRPQSRAEPDQAIKALLRITERRDYREWWTIAEEELCITAAPSEPGARRPPQSHTRS